MLLSFIKKIDYIDRFLYLICLSFAALFELSQLFEFTYNYSFIIKSVPIICLIILTKRHLIHLNQYLLIGGLIFCVMGDIFLDLNRIANFKLAILVYLIGHLFYITIFHRNFVFNKKYLIPIILVSISTLIIGYFLRDIPKDLLIPVLIYLLIIGIMVASSFLIKNVNWLIWTGALIFMLSDTIIAVNKFIVPIPKSTFYNIGLYYIAQIALVTGLLFAYAPKFKLKY